MNGLFYKFNKIKDHYFNTIHFFFFEYTIYYDIKKDQCLFM